MRFNWNFTNGTTHQSPDFSLRCVWDRHILQTDHQYGWYNTNVKCVLKCYNNDLFTTQCVHLSVNQEDTQYEYTKTVSNVQQNTVNKNSFLKWWVVTFAQLSMFTILKFKTLKTNPDCEKIKKSYKLHYEIISQLGKPKDKKYKPI